MFVKKVYAGGGKHKTPGSDDPGMGSNYDLLIVDCFILLWIPMQIDPKNWCSIF